MTGIYKILTFLCLFYPGILLFYYGFEDSKRHYEIIPNWIHHLEKNILLRNRNIEDQPIFKRNYFFNKRGLVYYNRQGEALHKISIDSKTLVFPDNDFYLISPLLGQKVNLFNNRGEKQWSLDTYAIPHITPFRKNIALLSSDLNTLTVYDYNRNLILPPTYLGTLITDYTFCENSDGIVLGTIEGNLYFFDDQVKQVFKKNFQDSRYNYLKSVVCSSTEDSFLTLDGLYPEWLTLLNRDGEALWRVNTEQDRRTPTDIFIDNNNGLVLDTRKNSIALLSLDQGKAVGEIRPNPEIGEITRVVFSSAPGWLLLGINGKQGHEILLLNQNSEAIWKNSLIGEYLTYAELQQDGDRIFFILHTVFAIYNYQLIL